jgi:hypothetical protein
VIFMPEPPMAKKKHRPKGNGRPKRWARSRPSPQWPLRRQHASPHRRKTWQEAAGQQETAVRLEQLPPGIDFPEGFPEPIAYDAARQLLIYRGLMTHDSYAYLRLLSADRAYLAAVDQLREATCRLYAQPTQPHFSRRWWLWLLLAVILVASLVAWWQLR